MLLAYFTRFVECFIGESSGYSRNEGNGAISAEGAIFFFFKHVRDAFDAVRTNVVKCIVKFSMDLQ